MGKGDVFGVGETFLGVGNDLFGTAKLGKKKSGRRNLDASSSGGVGIDPDFLFSLNTRIEKKRGQEEKKKGK